MKDRPMTASPNTPEAREHLLSLRRAIEESGEQLLTQEELEKEIGEMRRRDF